MKLLANIKLIGVGALALIAGLVLGNMRGEWVGYDRGYAACEEANRVATREANDRALAEQERLLEREQLEEAEEHAARAEIAAAGADECRDLTPAERAALDSIGVK